MVNSSLNQVPSTSFKRILFWIKNNLAIVAIIILATWLRTDQLTDKAIFYGDAASDMLVAAEAVTQRQLPLLGIESSLPRFRQGPVTVWIHMLIFNVAHYQTFAYSLVFALISCVGIIVVYNWLHDSLHTSIAIIVSLIMAVSPLAVAHARVPFQIGPIPLATGLFLWALTRLKPNNLLSWWWLGLAWAVLFQFELSHAPLFFVPIVITWRLGWRTSWKPWFSYFFAAAVGIWPQLLYDATHNFSHLGGFVVWVAYRIASAASLVGDHALTPNKFLTTVNIFNIYWQRLFGLESNWVYIFILGIGLAGLVRLSWWWFKAAPYMATAWQGVTVTSWILIIAYFIHGTPSEAYFPAFIVLFPVWIASWWPVVLKFQPLKFLVILGLGWWAAYQVLALPFYGYFVNPKLAFNYGPGIGEQTEIMNLIVRTSPQFTLATTDPGGIFPNYFDNLRWLALSAGTQEIPHSSHLVFVENPNSDLAKYPGVIRYSFSSRDIYFLP